MRQRTGWTFGVAALALAAATVAAADDPKARIEAAAAGLEAGPYRFDFTWSRSGGEREPGELVGRAVVAPGVEGSGRFRIEAGPAGGDITLVVADDGETLRVFDRGAGEFWFSPRYRAGVFLSDRYLGALLPLALSADGLRNAARYSARWGDPIERNGRACDTVELPLPKGAWRLSFHRGRPVPCRFELTIEGGTRDELELDGWQPSDGEALYAIAPPPGTEEREFTPGGPAPGEAAPALALELDGGGRWSLEEQRGKVVLLDFWATWCVPCRSSMQAVQALLDARPDKPVVAIGLNVMDQGNRTAFIEELGIRYPWAVADAAVADWGIDQTGLPALFVVAADGRVADYFLGSMDAAEKELLAETVDGLLTGGEASGTGR